MKLFTKPQFQTATKYLKERARDLDRTWFMYEFESSVTAADVLKALCAYQNPDGGFGRAIEPDVRCAESSAYGTTVALQHLSRLKATRDNDVIVSTMGYLLSVFHADNSSWYMLPPEADNAPRAPWWQYREQSYVDLAAWANPNAEIVGYIYKYPSFADRAWMDHLAECVLTCLTATADEMEMHALLCFLRFAERCPEDVQKQVWPLLDDCVMRAVSVDPNAWTGYGLTPLQIATSPESRYYAQFQEAVDKQLDWIIESQNADGTWAPTWVWGQFEDDWSKALTEWKGILTLDNLRLLRAFGRTQL